MNNLLQKARYRLERISKLSPELRLDKAHEFYTYDWSRDSAYFSQKGYYQWMAKQLEKYFIPKLVLDIGCGTGEGILALIKQFSCNIIAIEENKHCINSAKTLLENQGISVKVIERMVFLPQLDNRENPFSYVNGYTQVDFSHDAQVTIIQGDWSDEDTELLNFLRSFEFDAVTVWLIGTHMLHQYLRTLPDWVNSDTHYRLKIQNRAYDIADEILRSGGVLNVIDRGINNMDDFLLNWQKNHEDQASTTSLQVTRPVLCPYEDTTNGIAMANNGLPMDTAPGQLVFVSTCSIKP